MAAPVSSPKLFGIPVPQLLGFAVTIAASFLSARWGSSENRKQFRKKNEDDERAAAAELVPLLMKLASECDARKGRLSEYMSSDGQAGADESVVSLPFPAEIHSSAARLGARITKRAIKLELTKQRAENYFAAASGRLDRTELDETLLSFFALLSLKSLYLADMAAEKVGLEVRHPEEVMERLRKEAFRFGQEIDSGDEGFWY